MPRYQRQKKPRKQRTDKGGKHKTSERIKQLRVTEVLRPAWGKGMKRKEYLFVMEYLTDLNQTQAYRRVYPDDSQAGAHASTLIRKPHIRKAIEEALVEQLGVPKSRILQELSDMAFSNAKDIASWDEDGNVKFKPSSKLTKSQMAAISSIHKNNSGLHIKFADKLGSLDRLAKLIGLTQIEEENSGAGNVIVNVIRFADGHVPEPPKTVHPIIDVPMIEGPKDDDYARP